MNVLHCPNPQCTKTFSAADIQRPGIVRCPSCGQEFRFQPPKKPANGQSEIPAKPANSPWMVPAMPAQSPPKVLPAKPIAAPPLAKPAVPVAPPPRAMPVLAQAPVPQAKSDKIVHIRRLSVPRSRHPVLNFVVLTLVIGIFVAAVFYGIYTIGPSLQFNKTDGPGGAGGSSLSFLVRNLRGQEEKAFTLTIDKANWTVDKDTKGRLKALVVFKHADPTSSAWFGVAVQDFGFHAPREGELVSGATERLKNLYGDAVEINSNKLEPAKIGGLDAMRCAFRARLNVVWNGECYLVSHHGFAYWVFIAGLTSDDVQQQFSEFEEQKAFAFTTDRRGWTEQPPELELFAALDNAFQVQTPDRIWQKNQIPVGEPKAVLYLAGNFRNLPNQKAEAMFGKDATLFGIAVDKKTDFQEAYKNAVAYFERKEQDEVKDYKFEPIKEAANAEVGDQPGCIGELVLLRGSEKMRYVMLAVFNDGTKTYGLRFECAWANQAIWRKEFQEVIKTVRLGQK